MSYNVSEIFPNYIVVNGEPDFSHGLLFPHNIVLHGEEISLPFALSIMDQVRMEVGLIDKATVLSRFGKDNNYAILEFDCSDIFKDIHLDKTLCENIVYTGTVLAKSYDATIVGINGNYGYISGVNTAQIDESISVSVVESVKNNFGFYRFSEAVQYTDGLCSLEGESESIEQFLTKEELSAVDEDTQVLIEWLLENIEGLTRRSINVVREELHLSYKPSTQVDLHRFLSETPNYFKNNNFWVGGYRDAETQNVKVIIYDNNNVVIEVLINATGMWITEFSHDKNKTNAQYLIDKNQKALVIAGTKIHIHENSYILEDYVEAGERIYSQYEVAKKLIPQLKRTIRTLKEKAGVEYLILKEFLAFQEQKEEGHRKNHSVSIGPNDAITTTTSRDGHSTGLEISTQTGAASLFTVHDSDVCYIELCRGEEKVKTELRESSTGNSYVIEFYTSHFPIEDWRRSGFEIRRRASVKHLILQQDSIKDFVYGGNRFDIFDKLNRDELISPEPDNSISFFDEKFNNIEAGNNQPLAIRKAVNNNDIFLIQGPPGTGKTSVIVEIIKQLVINKGERVLVCSQAHSAVKNIYSRIVGADDRIKIGNIDEGETMIPDNLKEHPEFLKNNQLLMKTLMEHPDDIAAIKKKELKIFELDYTSSSKNEYLKRHGYICDYYLDNKPENPMDLIGILGELRKGLLDLGDEAKAFNDARHYQSLNVVMGTCIGVGLDWGLQRSGIRFDTVIIDEAGKANLSETIVPMQLGKKFILVGDQKQLPPYMDTEEISTFLEQTKRVNLKQEEVEAAISSSLFEDFLEDNNFPKDSTVLLNYQYRMNPEIGDYVSELFYGGELQNGVGTENQQCNLDGFPNAVTFIDTSTNEFVDGHNLAHEKGDPVSGWYNPREIEIFKTRLLPRIERVKAANTGLKVGVITPYRRQRSFLLEALKGTSLEGAVYTIDSIQGTEFDIVVFSLVRAFNPYKKNRKVGFLDDMRRLNVALSRAKKKLVLIGNLHTLCAESAHFEGESNLGIKPVEVFRKLREIKERTAEKTSLELIKDKMASREIAEGQIFEDCHWKFEKDDRLVIELPLDGEFHLFPIKKDRLFECYGMQEKTVNVKFLGIAIDGCAKFEYCPDVPISQQVSDGIVWNTVATPVNWTEDGDDIMIFRFEDGSELPLPIYQNTNPQGIFECLLDSPEVKYVHIFIFNGGTVSLDKGPYELFAENHKTDENVKIEVIDDFNRLNFYIVKCENVYGKVMRRKGLFLRKGQVVRGTVYRMFNDSVIFNIQN